jgi:hypothetical protein
MVSELPPEIPEEFLGELMMKQLPPRMDGEPINEIKGDESIGDNSVNLSLTYPMIQ